MLDVVYDQEQYQSMLHENRKKITIIYDWELVTDQYDNHFLEIEGVINR
jgi:hypothetical protein